jgi:CheY-like chemotaxis protein
MTQVARAIAPPSGRNDTPEGRWPAVGHDGSGTHHGCHNSARPADPAHPTILLVDDDQDVREAVSSALEEEGYLVVSAGEGAEALAALRSSCTPRLILLDLTMPRMTGVEFRHTLLTEMPELSAVPVVVISADVEGREKARALGASAFLRKPLRLNELFRHVRAHLRTNDNEHEA